MSFFAASTSLSRDASRFKYTVTPKSSGTMTPKDVKDTLHASMSRSAPWVSCSKARRTSKSFSATPTFTVMSTVRTGSTPSRRRRATAASAPGPHGSGGPTSMSPFPSKDRTVTNAFRRAFRTLASKVTQEKPWSLTPTLVESIRESPEALSLPGARSFDRNISCASENLLSLLHTDARRHTTSSSRPARHARRNDNVAFIFRVSLRTEERIHPPGKTTARQ